MPQYSIYDPDDPDDLESKKAEAAGEKQSWMVAHGSQEDWIASWVTVGRPVEVHVWDIEEAIAALENYPRKLIRIYPHFQSLRKWPQEEKPKILRQARKYLRNYREKFDDEDMPKLFTAFCKYHNVMAPVGQKDIPKNLLQQKRIYRKNRVFINQDSFPPKIITQGKVNLIFVNWDKWYISDIYQAKIRKAVKEIPEKYLPRLLRQDNGNLAKLVLDKRVVRF